MSRVAQKVEEAQQLLAQGQPAQALALLQRVGGPAPRDPMLVSALCMCAAAAHELPKAEFYARQLVTLAGQHSDAHANLAMILARMGPAKHAEAKATYAKALSLDPFNDSVRTGFANLLMQMGEPAAALAICVASTSGAAGTPISHQRDQLRLTHASCLASMCRCEEAEALLRGSIPHANSPFTAFQMSILRCAMMLNIEATPDDTAQAHALVAQCAAATLEGVQHRVPVPAGLVDASRPLRVGLLSPDLRTHSVAFFVEAIMANLPRDRFELHALHNAPGEDATSARLRTHCASWTPVHHYPDDTLVDVLRSMRLDILLDLTGLAGHHRLRVLAARVAPVQATYCGYPDTTGIGNVDYRVVDRLTDPSSDSPQAITLRADGQPDYDQRCAERLIRLPDCFLCYTPPKDAPEPGFAQGNDPREPSTAITYGSFNTARKISPACVRLWTRVLQHVPNSRMLLKSKELGDMAMVAQVRSMFVACGLSEEHARTRLLVTPSTPSIAEHLALYGQVHIALDTYPYHGTTTTCEAMWMGVPVVSRVGNRHVSRVGLTLLTQAGLTDLAASSDDAFVHAATALASDANRLAHERATLRDRLRASKLCDARAFGETWSRVLLDMAQGTP